MELAGTTDKIKRETCVIKMNNLKQQKILLQLLKKNVEPLETIKESKEEQADNTDLIEKTKKNKRTTIDKNREM